MGRVCVRVCFVPRPWHFLLGSVLVCLHCLISLKKKKNGFRDSRKSFLLICLFLGKKYCVKRSKKVPTLVSFLSGSAKLAVWLSRTVPEGLLKTRLGVEHTTIRSLF